eukprot:Selendium_serpulae@DN2829_c0_g1_i2.p3
MRPWRLRSAWLPRRAGLRWATDCASQRTAVNGGAALSLKEAASAAALWLTTHSAVHPPPDPWFASSGFRVNGHSQPLKLRFAATGYVGVAATATVGFEAHRGRHARCRVTLAPIAVDGAALEDGEAVEWEAETQRNATYRDADVSVSAAAGDLSFANDAVRVRCASSTGEAIDAAS